MNSVVPLNYMRALLATAGKEYTTQLAGSPGESLLLERDLTPQSIKAFGLGYVKDPISGDERFQGMISIPYFTRSGIVSMRFRKVEGDGPKYLSVHNDKGRPFNLAALKGSDPVFITEGEMDAIILSQLHITAVGLPGAQSWKPVYARLFRFRRVYVLQDGDDSGAQFGETLSKSIPGAKAIDMGLGRDVNSVYSEHGEGYLREWIGLE